MDKASLAQYGIDYEQGVARCAGDPDFFRMLLTMFLKDETFAHAKAAFDCGDDKGLFSSMHELKGVSGTASLCQLYDAVCLLVEYLRAGGTDAAEKARLFALVEKHYRQAYEGITRFTAA